MGINFNKSILNQSTYKITTLQDKAKTLISNGIDIINATIGDPKDDTPKEIIDSLVNSIESQTYSQYPPYIGSDELRAAIVSWANEEYKVKFDKDKNIVSCNGTKEAIFSLPFVFDWSKDNIILIPSLSYPVYKMSADYLDIPYQLLPLSESNQFLPNIDEISKKTLQKTQLVWLNSPHNPTTTIASKAYLEKWVGLAEKHNFIICSDECYNDLYSDVKPSSILEIDSNHWVCFRSLSKRSHMTGYRSGTIISKNEDLINILKKTRAPMGVGTPSFIQSSARWAWLNNKHVEDHRKHYNQKRKKIKNALLNAGCDIFGGDAGFYMWVKSNQYNSSEAFAEWFLKKGILVTPGTVFGDDGNPYVRLVFCLKDKELDKMIKRIES